MAFITTPGEIKNRADFFFQTSSMLDAGISLPRILQTLTTGSGSKQLREMSSRMSILVEQGHTYAEASHLEMHWASPFEKALIEAGETSGTLDRTLRQLGEYLDKKSSLLRQSIGYLIYPIMVVHVALFVFPINQIQGILVAGGIERLIMNKAITFGLLYAAVFGSIVMFQKSSSSAALRVKAAIFSWIPLLGSSLKELALARIAMALYALFNAGVPVGRSWALAAEAGSNAAICQEIEQWKPMIEDEGYAPSELLNASRSFPQYFISTYQTGETSGKLDDSLKRIEKHYSESGMNKLSHFSQWLPRVVYFFIVIAIAFQIISFYSGMFQQTNQFLE